MTAAAAAAQAVVAPSHFCVGENGWGHFAPRTIDLAAAVSLTIPKVLTAKKVNFSTKGKLNEKH